MVVPLPPRCMRARWENSAIRSNPFYAAADEKEGGAPDDRCPPAGRISAGGVRGRPAAAGARTRGDADRQHLASAACGRPVRPRIIRELARERGGRERPSLWFDAGAKLPVADAAQVNAVMSDAAASDDSDLRNIIHAGTPLTATSLAHRRARRCERRGGAGGDRLRLRGGRTDRRGDHPRLPQRGFHGCLGAIFAAAVAAGRLLRLDAAQMAQAIALSATSIGGLGGRGRTPVSRANITRGLRRCSA